MKAHFPHNIFQKNPFDPIIGFAHIKLNSSHPSASSPSRFEVVSQFIGK
jgi:hypothetical protein